MNMKQVFKTANDELLTVRYLNMDIGKIAVSRLIDLIQRHYYYSPEVASNKWVVYNSIPLDNPVCITLQFEKDVYAKPPKPFEKGSALLSNVLIKCLSSDIELYKPTVVLGKMFNDENFMMHLHSVDVDTLLKQGAHKHFEEVCTLLGQYDILLKLGCYKKLSNYVDHRGYSYDVSRHFEEYCYIRCKDALVTTDFDVAVHFSIIEHYSKVREVLMSFEGIGIRCSRINVHLDKKRTLTLQYVLGENVLTTKTIKVPRRSMIAQITKVLLKLQRIRQREELFLNTLKKKLSEN